MQGKIILVSDDVNFFEYILPKLTMVNTDNIVSVGFDSLPEIINTLNNSIIIVNSENNKKRTLELMSLIKELPAIVFSYDYDESFILDGYKAGMFAYITLSTSNEKINAIMHPIMKYLSSQNRKNFYRNILVNNKIINKNNEVFYNCEQIVKQFVENVSDDDLNKDKIIIAAISPDDKSKFTIHYNQIETVILNNINENDILVNYAPHKYFILFKDTEYNSACTIVDKIINTFTEPLFAGLSVIKSKNYQQIINDVLNKLHKSINEGFNTGNKGKDSIISDNFKFFREEFNKKISQIITPVFYNAQQVYNNKLFGIEIEQEVGEGFGTLKIKSKKNIGCFKITSPGFSNINIDISISANMTDNLTNEIESKRISLEPDELEIGLLEDLLSQFILEFKKETE